MRPPRLTPDPLRGAVGEGDVQAKRKGIRGGIAMVVREPKQCGGAGVVLVGLAVFENVGAKPA